MDFKSLYEILKKHGALAGISLFLFLQNIEQSKRIDSVEVKLFQCYEARILTVKPYSWGDSAIKHKVKFLAVLPEQIEIKRERKDESA